MRRVLTVVLSLSFVLAWVVHTSVSHAQDSTPTAMPHADQVQVLISSMTVQQKVGQLFIVSFAGSDVSPTSDIADLIVNDHIGGVQLRATNQNFNNAQAEPPVTQQIAQLTNALQSLATEDTPNATSGDNNGGFVETPAQVVMTGIDAVTGSLTQPLTSTLTASPSSIPLFIALSQEADWTTGSELSEITQGVTQIPSELALGATWNPSNTHIAGEILGGELSQLGINVLLGPSLDVVDTPRPNTPGDLGTHVFGGDPFWVGKHGAAFIAGVHRGSNNRMAVVAKNFPGLGSSDRNASDEIPTVQKSLEQLKQIELAPFFAAMKNDATASSATVDGLLVSHIRYRGFQGNIRASTRPVSFDPQAYRDLMALPEVAQWRAGGGVTFSDLLGARSVRRFYDSLESSFNARRIAQEAFVAGNDVLVLGNFGLSNSWPEQLANVKDAIRFFQTRYVEDQNFAARVDESLARILALKLRLYGGRFTRASAQVDEVRAGQLQPQVGAVSAIAAESITLLAPHARDLPAVLPTQPTQDESIVFITDDRTIRECIECEPYPAVPRTALEEIALNLYGPRTTGQVDPTRVSSFTFSDLVEYNRKSSTPTPTPTPQGLTLLPTSAGPAVGEPSESTPTPTPQEPLLKIQTDIERSSWIVITMIDTNPAISSTVALRTFLSQSADSLRDKRVIVFALGAPYYLDATEISKATAYFGVYSRTPAFLEAALRGLFGEFAPNGASPASVTSLNYSLLTQTAPDKDQIIPLSTGDIVTDTQATPAPLELKIGDRLKLRAGPIYDLNGNIVPDNTPVQFILNYPAERVEQREPAVTRDGVAETTIALVRQGTLEIRAEADPALSSDKIVVNATDTVSIERIRPTFMPTQTPQPTATIIERPTSAPTATVATTTQTASTAPRSNMTSFLVTLAGLFTVSIGVFAALAQTAFGVVGQNTRVRVALGLWMFGWLIYGLTALGVPGTGWASRMLDWAGSALMSVVLAMLSAGFVLAILRVRNRAKDSGD